MSRYKDLTGMKIGRLKVIEPIGSKLKAGRWNMMWKCKCECGNEVIRSGSHLLADKKAGRNSSCGCYVKERGADMCQTHGLRYTRIAMIHRNMLVRCYNKNDKRYYKYGGRGITVCDEWRNSSNNNIGLQNFYKWAYENGYYDQPDNTPRADKLTIERKDVNGPYAPWNCTWIRGGDQALNRTTTRRIYDGEEWLVHAQFEDKYGWHRATVSSKLQHGWSTNAIIFAARHPELKIYKMHKQAALAQGYPEDTYMDKDGFPQLIPKVRIPEEDKR